MEHGSFRVRTARWFVLLGVMLALSPVCGAAPPEQAAETRKLLKDPSAEVRRRAALALAEAHDAEAIPVLIDLLAELPDSERQGIEAKLRQLAGEWAPNPQLAGDDAISRRIRRDVWKAWWHNTDSDALLAIVREHMLTPDKRRRLQELLPHLGSDDFAVRESASEQVQSFGRLALPALRETSKARDAEMARRAKMLIESIENGPDARLPVVALRLLAVRKPADAVEALLAYLPFADDETREEEIGKSLRVLARRDGKLDPALRRALADKQPKVRAVAAETLIERGGDEGRVAVATLVKEDTPPVRLRAAMALARAGQREGVALLIDLLPLLDEAESGQAENALYQLAGDSAPQMKDVESGDARKRRTAWLAWWKVNADRIDPARLGRQSWLGYTLVCDTAAGRIYEIDRQGRQRWAIEKLSLPVDAVVLPGNRVLIAECSANRVTERDFKGNILWEVKVNQPVSVQRLANGNTFIASDNDSLREVDRMGKDVYVIPRPPAGQRAGYRTRQGTIVYLCISGECVRVDRTGKRLGGFPTPESLSDLGTMVLTPNGRIVVTLQQSGRILEYDASGKKILEVQAPKPSTANVLPNGHFLVASHQLDRVYELDRSGKIVWEFRNAGNVYRARQR